MDDLLNTAPCGFLTFADDGTILLANATLLDMLGRAPGELPGQRLESILSVGGRIFYHTHFFPLLGLQGRAEEIYFSLRSESGEDVPVLVNAVRRERDGAIVNDCVFVRIRERARYEDEILKAKKEAEEASRAKAKFLSMMSHDLRTPLTAITGFTEILSMGIHGPLTELQLEDLRRIRSSSEYLLDLINDILNFARLESGRVDVRVETVSVDAALIRAESLLTLQLQEAGLEYAREECAAEVAVRADPDRLQQILLNLLTNAIKFTERGGRIAVACERAGSRFLIHIRDTGRGIPADRIDKIFEPFFQIDRQQTKATRQGVGLGLAISRELARAMGGDLTVASTPGRGSVFTVTLPAVESSDSA